MRYRSLNSLPSSLSLALSGYLSLSTPVRQKVRLSRDLFVPEPIVPLDPMVWSFRTGPSFTLRRFFAKCMLFDVEASTTLQQPTNVVSERLLSATQGLCLIPSRNRNRLLSLPLGNERSGELCSLSGGVHLDHPYFEKNVRSRTWSRCEKRGHGTFSVEAHDELRMVEVLSLLGSSQVEGTRSLEAEGDSINAIVKAGKK